MGDNSGCAVALIALGLLLMAVSAVVRDSVMTRSVRAAEKGERYGGQR